MFSGSSAALIVRMMSTPSADLLLDEADLALPDAMLAGAGAVHALAPAR